MILPKTDISMMLVRNAIGNPTVDLGRLVANAKTGGKSGFAFNILENGSFAQDGTRIQGAFPYWNIWANNQPGQWVLPSTDDKTVVHELKRDASNKYCFQLGGFAAHNTDAAPPTPMAAALSFVKHGSYVDYSFAAKINLGDYDWTNLTGVTHCKVMVYYPDGALFSESNILPCQRNATMTFNGFTMRIPTNAEYKSTYPTIIALCQPDGNELGWLPTTGEIIIEVKNAVNPFTIGVRVNNNPKAFSIGGYIDGGSSARSIGTYTGLVDANRKRLAKIEYSIINSNTNEVVSTLDVTNFDATYEGPLILDMYSAGDVETFYVSKTRVYPTTGQYIRAIMYYE